MESTIFIAVLFKDACVSLAWEDFELVKEQGTEVCDGQACEFAYSLLEERLMLCVDISFFTSFYLNT